MSVFGKNSGALLAKVNPNITDPPGDKKEDPPKDSKPDFGDGQTKANALGAKNNVDIKNIKIENPAYSSNYELAGMSIEELSKLPVGILIQNYEASTGDKILGNINNPMAIAQKMEREGVGPFDEAANFVRSKGGFQNLSKEDFRSFLGMEVGKIFGKQSAENPSGDLGFLLEQGIKLAPGNFDNKFDANLLFHIDRRNMPGDSDKEYFGMRNVYSSKESDQILKDEEGNPVLVPKRRPVRDIKRYLDNFKNESGQTERGTSDGADRHIKIQRITENISKFLQPYKDAYQYLYAGAPEKLSERRRTPIPYTIPRTTYEGRQEGKFPSQVGGRGSGGAFIRQN
jgi:hypothetical protein